MTPNTKYLYFFRIEHYMHSENLYFSHLLKNMMILNLVFFHKNANWNSINLIRNSLQLKKNSPNHNLKDGLQHGARFADLVLNALLQDVPNFRHRGHDGWGELLSILGSDFWLGLG